MQDTVTRAERYKLTRAELIQDVTYATRVSPQAAELAVDAMLEAITESLTAGLEVELRGFGRFGVRRRGLHLARRRATGARLKLATHRVAYFEPGKELTQRVDA